MLSRTSVSRRCAVAEMSGPTPTRWAKVPSSSGRSVELRTITTGRLMIVASS